MTALLDVARLQGKGLALFAIEHGGTRPYPRLAPHGFTDATTNELAIRRLFEGDVNVGIATGRPLPGGGVLAS